MAQATGRTRDSRRGPADRRRRPLPRLPLSATGTFIGLVFFAASLTPSLIPRDAVMQGLVGGASFAAGYGVAVAGRALWRWLELPLPEGRAGRVVAVAAPPLGLLVAGYALSRAAEWQNGIRTLMTLEPLETTHPLRVALLAAAVAALLIVLGWLFVRLATLLSRWAARLVPPRLAATAGLVAAVLLAAGIADGVLVRNAMAAVDAFYARLDSFMPPGSAPPEDPARSGSAASLVAWGDLGSAGRAFVSRMPSGREIAAVRGEPAVDPVRVYVGLGSAGSVGERAQLALRELIRVGGFERSLLVVSTPTGTGFMEEAAIAPLEYLHRGDVATVGMQYSYLQSPFSLLFEPGYGAGSARALMHAVYTHWAGLPADDRPRLYLQGLSLGSLSSERSVRLHEVLGDPPHGALWSGPPFPSPIHADVTRYRAPGSPAWLPRFEDGSFIRFTGRENALDVPGAEWGPMRIVYLQHASDPIVFFSPSLFWTRPDWLAGERGPDVSPDMRWYPIVTALQVAADMAVATNVPRGYGHEYASASYIDAWMEITEPDATPADVHRLKRLFAE